MPANLTQQYKEAEARFRAAADHDGKVDALREMLALLPKHKGTEKLHGDLKKRLAKLEAEGEQAARSGGGRRPDPGHVKREGAGQWALLGPPNAGKSALLAALTHAHPEVAEYPFTTRAAQPGMMPFEDVQVQLVDAPAVAAGHTPPWLANLVQGADGLLLVLDPTADDLPAAWAELEALFTRAHAWPAPRPLPAGASPLLRPRPALVALTRRDLDDEAGSWAALAGEVLGPELAVHRVSAVRGDGLEALRGALWGALGRLRVYTREPGKKADPGRPFVLPAGATVHDLALLVHRELADRLKFARLWGAARFEGQQVDRHHLLADRDVVELHA